MSAEPETVTEHLPPAAVQVGRQITDPVVRKLFYWTTRGPASAQEFVLRSLREQCGVVADEEQADALDALRECAKELQIDACPSRDQYRAWQARQQAADGWSSPGGVDKVFGGWSNARAVFDGRPVIDFRRTVHARCQPPLANEQLVADLRRWRSDAQESSWNFESFRDWALDRIAASDGRERHVVAQRTYVNKFGSWLGALAAASLAEQLSYEDYKRLARASREATDEQLKQHLREASDWAASVLGKELTLERLQDYREVVLRCNYEQQCWVSVPGHDMVVRRLGDGSLPKALLAAGAISREDAVERLQKRGQYMTDAQLAAHVEAVCAVLGLESRRPVSMYAYRPVRDALVAVSEEPVPSEMTIYNRLGEGDWERAVSVAREIRTDPELVAALRDRYQTAMQASTNENVGRS